MPSDLPVRRAAWRAPPLSRYGAIGLLAWLLAVSPACSSRDDGGRRIHVYAAVSLKEALTSIGAAFERRYAVGVSFNFGGSNGLALAIEEGAPADVFLSADAAKMDRLEAKGLVAAGTRRNLLTNSLVIVTRKDQAKRITNVSDLEDPSVRRIAVAEPESVPAGIYAREYLRSVGLWDRLSGRILPAENVRGALAAVESGSADAGIVYRTDAGASKEVVVAFEVPSAEGPLILYPAAVLTEARSPGEARTFVEYLSSEEALAVFRDHGFRIAEPPRSGG